MVCSSKAKAETIPVEPLQYNVYVNFNNSGTYSYIDDKYDDLIQRNNYYTASSGAALNYKVSLEIYEQQSINYLVSVTLCTTHPFLGSTSNDNFGSNLTYIKTLAG